MAGEWGEHEGAGVYRERGKESREMTQLRSLALPKECFIFRLDFPSLTYLKTTFLGFVPSTWLNILQIFKSIHFQMSNSLILKGRYWNQVCATFIFLTPIKVNTRLLNLTMLTPVPLKSSWGPLVVHGPHFEKLLCHNPPKNRSSELLSYLAGWQQTQERPGRC